MIIKVNTATTLGLQTQLIECEIDLAGGLPAMVIVGLPDKAVQESKERIRSSIKQSGFEFPLGKITVNLAPADVAKAGSSLDLPIAIGILSLVGYIIPKLPENVLFAGELSLDGKLRAINGTLSICIWAAKNGYQKIFIPKENSQEAALVSGIEIYAVEDLMQVVDYLNDKKKLSPIEPIDLPTLRSTRFEKVNDQGLLYNDIAYVRGQETAKRALEIAASGGHNVLFIGQPGSGKTLLARSYPTILPAMTEKEILEVTQIYSVAGMLGDDQILLERPFRSPHHSASHIALVGGGSKLRPGEISLAHRGVLFLDEFPEFSRETIEALRQPLEDGSVTISRASGSVHYPSRFYLLAAANPTPSGYEADDPDIMNKPQNKAAISRYQAKFSGPILDRIDLQVEVNRPTKEELQNKELGVRSSIVRDRVQKARDIQTKRFDGENIYTNGEMNLRMIEKYCVLDEQSQKVLSQAVDKFKLSARSYMRLLKLSRTIADLAGAENISIEHLLESLQYRGKWG
ncbi:MAG: YifB family Mg chelatase-like AAA ATPase [bacterium]